MKIKNTNELVPSNPRNNCLCDTDAIQGGIPCYYHVKKGLWFSKEDNEPINPKTWQYAILPWTQSASFENMLLTLVQFGLNTFKQEFNKLKPDKQKEIFDEWTLIKEKIKDEFKEED